MGESKNRGSFEERRAAAIQKQRLMDEWTEEVHAVSKRINLGMGTVGLFEKKPPHAPSRFVIVNLDELIMKLAAKHVTQIPGELIGEFDAITIDGREYTLPAGLDVSAASTVAALAEQGLDAYVNPDGGISWRLTDSTETVIDSDTDTDTEADHG